MTESVRTRRVVLLAVLLVASACGGVSPKAAIDRADRSAYVALRTFQQAETGAWQTRQRWLSADRHIEINRRVSAAYQLIADVANLGISLPPGSHFTVDDLAALAKLTQVVADILQLTKGAPPAVQQQAAVLEGKADALKVAVAGGVR